MGIVYSVNVTFSRVIQRLWSNQLVYFSWILF